MIDILIVYAFISCVLVLPGLAAVGLDDISASKCAAVVALWPLVILLYAFRGLKEIWGEK